MIPKKYLLLLAGLVWGAAGFNILRLGLTAIIYILGVSPHYPLSLPSERLDKPRCPLILGHLPKHPLHHHGDSHYHPLL